MIPMARLGRSAAKPDKEEVAPLYLPETGTFDYHASDLLTDPEDLDTLLDILDEILDVIGPEKENFPHLMKFIEENLTPVGQDPALSGSKMT